MKALEDPGNALASGLAAIRGEHRIPVSFPDEVLHAAERAAGREPADHVDRTGMHFVTLDPAASTDLDQAFAIERSGGDLLLHYAIADVAWFVDDGDAVDREAWRRGTSFYLPDGKSGLYPPVLSEGAASLLPAGSRPAVIFTIRIAADGAVHLDGAERAVIRSKAKLAYETVRDADLPEGFTELSERIESAERRRGAARVNPPAQEIVRLPEGGFELQFRPPLQSEERNAAMSLAANMAVAEALQAHGTGLFRVMAEPDEWAVRRLRHTARALDIDWPRSQSLREIERRLDAADPKQASLMLAIRRAGQGASYAPYEQGTVPWHAAVAATYAHATAPLRRLADRYVVRAALAVANGEAVPAVVAEAFAKLPAVMARAESLGGRIERAAIDLAETVMLRDREGEIFPAIATDVDKRGVRIQLCGLPVVARMAAEGVKPGDKLAVRLLSSEPEQRALSFERAQG